jgi:translation initiation factor IF-3
VKEVRLIGAEGNQVGIVALDEAKKQAEDEGLDLVEISPNAKPPVCKILDYGKYIYEQSKKEKNSKKKQHTVVVKEIRMRPKTDDHDMDYKIKHARSFIEHKYKVKFTVQFRGRELAYKQFGVNLLERVTEAMEDIAKVESEIKSEGRNMTIIFTAK